jgi:hypothetical protein
MLFGREIEIAGIVKHCFFSSIFEFTDSEKIASFVVLLICLTFLSQNSGSGEIFLPSIQISSGI